MTGGFDPESHQWARHEHVIVFDGLCNWCNAWVNFVIDHDPHEKFKFGTLQSDQGQQILHTLRLSTENFSTFLLLEQARVCTKSTAALRIVRQLPGFWPLFYLGILIPRPLRDALYDYVARHRYRWMGKTGTCRIPSPDQRRRFV
ncbi:MAG TPA: thiol-disulfide oxidoreductase DCC family protein [Nitrospira sp.]|nr:thiol-disulfide oxidoreductase DCC family protein [Nitrospira sp.]